MNHLKWRGYVLVVLVVVLTFIGCAKPPEAEKEAAKAAMDAALSAGAEKYAASDLDSAKKIWEAAESQKKEKKYKEAKQSYMDAKVAFEKAVQAAETGKKVLMDQTNAALIGIEESWRNVEAMAKKMGEKLKDRGAWATDVKAISEGMAEAKEMISADPSQARVKLDDLKVIVDKWENRFKEMGALPKGSGQQSAPSKKGITSHEAIHDLRSEYLKRFEKNEEGDLFQTLL